KVGNRYWEWSFLGLAYPAYALGDWDDVTSREAGLPDDDWTRVRIAFATLLTSIIPVRLHRGEIAEAQRLTRLFGELESSADVQERAQVRLAEASLLHAAGEHAEALLRAEQALEVRHAMGIGLEAVKEAFVVAVEAALALDDVTRARELVAIVDELPPGH